jgi:hypothetical protein
MPAWPGRGVALAIVVVTAAGCATAPTAPSVMVLPGAGLSLEQFQADETQCRQWAAGRAPGAGQQREYDMAYMQCMYAKGHQIPGVRRSDRPGGATPPAYSSSPGSASPGSAAPPASPPSR